MKLSDVITPGDKIDIKMLHEANQEDNGGEIAKIYQSAVSDIFSDQELEISMWKNGVISTGEGVQHCFLYKRRYV